jgi:hypothetical protein
MAGLEAITTERLRGERLESRHNDLLEPIFGDRPFSLTSRPEGVSPPCCFCLKQQSVRQVAASKSRHLLRVP